MIKFRLYCIVSGILMLAVPHAAYSGDSTASMETGAGTEQVSQFTDTHSGSTAVPPAAQAGSSAAQAGSSAAQAGSSAAQAGSTAVPPAAQAGSTAVSPAVPNSAVVPPAGDAKTPESEESTDNSKKNTGETVKPDYSSGSISQAGLIVAEENRWYHEEFDRHGRPISAVLFDKETELETIQWKYRGTSHRPSEKTISTAGKGRQHIQYDAAGNSILIEEYDSEKKLIEKTENTYNSNNNLIEQRVFDGQHHDKTVWVYTNNTAVSQTKYRDNEKIVFIELQDDKRIVHIFVDGKEVFVTEEP
ncbi:MAG: hypothetical protein ACTTH8_04265 [Treponema sp.]